MRTWPTLLEIGTILEADSESYTYDEMGRITNVSKVISGATYNVGYGYNAAGQLQSLTYPSGRIVSQGYDALGRLNTIASGPTMFSSPTYNAAGQLLSFVYGNGATATFTYNQRLQVASLVHSTSAGVLLSLQYNYSGNGQIGQIKYFNSAGEDPTKSPNFEYDAWGRLKKAYTSDLSQQGTWRLEWEYDRFGNRRTQTLTGGAGLGHAATTGDFRNYQPHHHSGLRLRRQRQPDQRLAARLRGSLS